MLYSLGSIEEIGLSSCQHRNSLFHYTTFEAFLHILRGKCLRLSRLDLINDKAEIHCTEDRSRYVLSFSHTGIEYISMWSMYGRTSDLRLRIRFDPKLLIKDAEHGFYIDQEKVQLIEELMWNNKFSNKKHFAYTDILYYSKEKKKLIDPYTEKVIANINVDTDNFPQLSGFIKYDAWEYEKESRLITSSLRIDEISNVCRYIYMRISDSTLSSMNVTFCPWMTPVMKEEVINAAKCITDMPIVFQDSKNDGEISLLT